MDRNPNASLSPREVNTLRALKRDLRRAVSGEDRKLLLAMGLAVEDGERNSPFRPPAVPASIGRIASRLGRRSQLQNLE